MPEESMMARLIERAKRDTMMARLIERANRDHDGHVTILKFTTNWRVGSGTILEDRNAIARMPEGKTFAEAARRPLHHHSLLRTIRICIQD